MVSGPMLPNTRIRSTCTLSRRSFSPVLCLSWRALTKKHLTLGTLFEYYNMLCQSTYGDGGLTYDTEGKLQIPWGKKLLTLACIPPTEWILFIPTRSISFLSCHGSAKNLFPLANWCLVHFRAAGLALNIYLQTGELL